MENNSLKNDIVQHGEVIKHSGVVHVQHKISLLGQQVFNVLLAYAFKSLKNTQNHKITVKEILKYVPSAKNVGHLRKILEEMCTPVRYNIFGKDQEEAWGFFALLPFAEIKKGTGVCEYSFTEKMVELIANPRMYAKINLLIQRQYSGNKYGWFLYELCFDYKDVGKTPILLVEDLKKYFGIEETQYIQFKIFRRNVINTAIKDINKQTDLTIKAQTHKTGRKITHIQFYITQKKGFQPALPLSLEELQPALEHIQEYPESQKKKPEKQEQLKTIKSAKNTPPKSNNPDLAEELKTVGVSTVATKEIIQKYQPEQITEAVQILIEAEKKEKGVSNPTAFVTRALKEGWQSENSIKKRKKQAVEAKLQKEKETQDAERRRAEESIKQEEERYKNSSDEEKFAHVLKQSQNIQKVYETLTLDNQNALKEYSNKEVFPFFHRFGSTFLHILREAKNLKENQKS